MILDTSSWVEFFIKSEKGELVKRILKNEECYTCIVTIAELSNWALRENQDGKELIKFVLSSTKLLDLNPEISFLAGKLNFNRKKTIKNWGMADSLILSTALFYNLKIPTKDNHFKDLENAEML